MTRGMAPEHVAEAVLRRLDGSSCPINAYWMCVSEDRDRYAEVLSDALAEEPVVVLVVRDGRFTNANALFADFVELISLNREACEQRLDATLTKCGFVLLSRSELAVPQISSPAALPEWFPIGGGTTVSALIEDLTWTADSSLAAPELKIGELCEDLLDLEEALLLRIKRVQEYDSDRRKTMAFLDLIRRETGEKLEDIVETALVQHASVTTPSSFRPSLRDARSLVARLWAVVQEKSPEQMMAASKAVATALDLPESLAPGWHESIESVLRRPSGGETDARLRFARNVLLTIGATCQLVTAAAHADSYEHYPIPLLRSFSYDLRRSLAEAAGSIRTLSEL
jgi:hypothetical protein